MMGKAVVCCTYRSHGGCNRGGCVGRGRNREGGHGGRSIQIQVRVNGWLDGGGVCRIIHNAIGDLSKGVTRRRHWLRLQLSHRLRLYWASGGLGSEGFVAHGSLAAPWGPRGVGGGGFSCVGWLLNNGAHFWLPCDVRWNKQSQRKPSTFPASQFVCSPTIKDFMLSSLPCASANLHQTQTGFLLSGGGGSSLSWQEITFPASFCTPTCLPQNKGSWNQSHQYPEHTGKWTDLHIHEISSEKSIQSVQLTSECAAIYIIFSDSVNPFLTVFFLECLEMPLFCQKQILKCCNGRRACNRGVRTAEQNAQNHQRLRLLKMGKRSEYTRNAKAAVFAYHSRVYEPCGVHLPLYGTGTMWGLPTTLWYRNYVGFACHSIYELCGVCLPLYGTGTMWGKSFCWWCKDC